MSERVEVVFGSPLVVVHQQARQPQVAVITLTVGNFVFKGVSIVGQSATGQAVSQSSEATIQSGGMGTVEVAWTDTGGNPARVDGPTTWSSTDESIIKVTGQSSNPLINNIQAVGPLGTAEVHANADADLGQGTQPVTAIIKFTVISGEAVGGKITFTPTGTHPPSPGGPQGSKPVVRGSR